MKIENFGEKAIGVTITGNPKKCEKETFRIAMPFGHVEVTRAIDGKPMHETTYWVHVFVNHPDSPSFCPDEDTGEYAGPGQIVDARLDLTDRHTGDVSVGDFDSPSLYHLAVKIGWREENRGLI